eukprot:3764185-Pyramimonas_sp.AAC.1
MWAPGRGPERGADIEVHVCGRRVEERLQVCTLCVHRLQARVHLPCPPLDHFQSCDILAPTK